MAGQRVDVGWQIQLPNEGGEIDEGTNTVTVIDVCDIEVIAIGAGYWNGNKNIELNMKINGGSSQKIFSRARASTFTSGQLLYSGPVKKGDRIDFGMFGKSPQTNGQGVRWSDLPKDDPMNSMVVLQDGDEVPDYIPFGTDVSIEEFLRPYLNQETGRVDIGPRDIIYLGELDRFYPYSETGDPLDHGYDMQDIVFIVSFKESQIEQ